MKVLTILTNGFEEIEAVGTIALLKRAGLTVDIACLHNNFATGRYDVTISNLKNLDDVNHKEYDLIFIPGGPEYVELSNTKKVLEIIKYAAEHQYLAGICAAPTIFGKLGLLKGKHYTCFTSMNEDFGGIYINKYAVRDGNIITGISAAGTIDFAFVIIEALLGENHANKVKNSIYY
jgi:putative intracellular protease/amidase